MNRSGLAFANFVARYKCNPTFHPVILNVMPQTDLSRSYMTHAVVSRSVRGQLACILFPQWPLCFRRSIRRGDLRASVPHNELACPAHLLGRHWSASQLFNQVGQPLGRPRLTAGLLLFLAHLSVGALKPASDGRFAASR